MISKEFADLLEEIPTIGKKHHEHTLLAHAQRNKPSIEKSIKNLPALNDDKSRSSVIISAGPSVHKQQSIQKIKNSKYNGTIVATDGSYIACLKQGLFPDYVITLDPHFSRVVRWFGDPNFEKHTANDDYYDRQDLDVEFRKNTIAQNKLNIDLVNRYSKHTKVIVCSGSHPETVVVRLKEAGFDMYWWNPLVDNPDEPDSLTRKLHAINPIPCLNTGGTVGTAAWVFASTFLDIPINAVVGMDFGYYIETSMQQTQMYYELIEQFGDSAELEKYFTEFVFPLTGERFYTDPTYYWYRQNFLELVERSKNKTINCTDAGTLVDHRIETMFFKDFLSKN
ncbi:MAG: motility associated factor glycosyltransferase family protein [Deltaproteobacteria bacterium]|nr:motility associated factor glycosyltransferase family protein [Deltaproteobacteria bacterium]